MSRARTAPSQARGAGTTPTPAVTSPSTPSPSPQPSTPSKPSKPSTQGAAVRLVRGKDYAIRRRHPWVFSGAIAEVKGDPGVGDVVVVEDAHGEVLGRAHFSPSSQIRARMISFGADVKDAVDDVVAARVRDAVAYRKRHVLSASTTSARLIFAESDGLPGVIVDQYDDTAVIQCQSAGAERMRDVVVDAVVAATGVARVFERSDAEIRALEGLEPRKGLLRGKALAGFVAMKENDLLFDVDVEDGHKTGFYLDQRDSRDLLRRVVAEHVAQEGSARVLNCFCYTGGFSIAALKGGATSVVSVDASRPALEIGEQNAKKNGFADGSHDWVRGDCFDVLRGMHDEGERFDVVVLDPPKFASKASHKEKAARGYKDLLLRGLALTKPGGFVFTFSCSGAIDRAFFREIAMQGSLEARRPTQIVGELGHARCHPVATSFPEGEYLKGLLLRAP